MTHPRPTPWRPPAIVSGPLLRRIHQQYQLSWHGIHGAGHWARVLENGVKLATQTGASPEVVALFALFHDACRANEDHDPEHGLRGGQLAARLRGTFFELDDTRLTLLRFACEHHTEGRLEGDVTVCTCWDADRLDLGRVGTEPDPALLCTESAREVRLRHWASERGEMRLVPDFVRAQWEPWLSSRASCR